jgi:hypothetical protein
LALFADRAARMRRPFALDGHTAATVEDADPVDARTAPAVHLGAVAAKEDAWRRTTVRWC